MPAILIVTAGACVGLLYLVGDYLWQLRRQRRDRAAGARLLAAARSHAARVDAAEVNR